MMPLQRFGLSAMLPKIGRMGSIGSMLIFLVGFVLPQGNAPAKESPSISKTARTNVILILVDDQGYYDLGCYGASEVKTPRIDALAEQGVRFTDYYAAAPICSPSRAGLLTGCYPRRVGNHIWVHRADSNQGIHPQELTLGELFQKQGYETACIGKWHLGFHEMFLPSSQGFDRYFGLLHNLDPVEVVYFEQEGGVPLMRGQTVVKRPADPSELTQLYTDEAIRFIEENKEDPFFLYLPHTMLHNPIGVSSEFRGASDWGDYGDAIAELDHQVGRIHDTLKKLQIDDRTLVVYTSDNGRGPGRTPQQKIRGRKLSTFEGGIRVPAIVWGPGIGVASGVTSSAVVRAMDWYPTLATFANIRVPNERVIDGRDISPLLKGETQTVPSPDQRMSLNADVPLRRWQQPQAEEWTEVFTRKEYSNAFFYHGSQGALSAVRWENWKLVLNPALQLFDLAQDPGESKPVRNGKISRKLRGMAVCFQHEMLRDARPPGRVLPPRADGRTEISPKLLKDLHAERNVTFAKYAERELAMDLFRPQNSWGTLPAIVCIHGGGWAKGNRQNHAKVAQALAARGYVTATISYRLSGEAPFPAAIEDCKAAVRFLRANANRYGIDADQIGAIGLSAGGHLTALLATSGELERFEVSGRLPKDPANSSFSSRIQAAVAMGAQTDLLSNRIRDVSAMPERGAIWRQFLSGSMQENPENYRAASPLEHLDREDPPIWFITGEHDDPSTRADKFRQRMNQLKIATGLTVIKDAPHPFLGQQVWFDQMVDQAANFFDKSFN